MCGEYMVNISKPYNVTSDIQRSLISRIHKNTYHWNWNSVRAFDMVLCDNRIDVDGTKFSIPALFQMRDMSIGKTGIVGKDYGGKDDIARIFDCRIMCDYGNRTADGEPLLYLKASAYYYLSDGDYYEFANAINNDYYNSVSVGCVIHKQTQHNGYTTIDSISDVYEWVLVVSPDRSICPLKTDNGKCVGGSCSCLYVEARDCKNYKNIYRLGLNNAPVKMEI